MARGTPRGGLEARLHLGSRFSPGGGGELHEERQGVSRLQHSQGRRDDLVLFVGHVWGAERVAQRPIDKEDPWGHHFLGHLAEQRNRDCGNSGFLYRALDQSHGLIAERSDRGQQDRVNAILAEKFCGLGCRLRDQAAWCRD